jgi:hypothetical protein
VLGMKGPAFPKSAKGWGTLRAVDPYVMIAF